MSEVIGTVEAVNDDGTITVTVRGDLVPSLPADPSYNPRSAGDRVRVRFDRGQALVLGKTAGSPPAAADTPWTASLASSAPGSGFEECASVWINTTTRQIVGVRLSAPPPVTSGRLERASTAVASYRDGKPVGRDRAEQGTWGGYGPHTGLFVFGDVWGPLAGRTITRVRVVVHRMNQGGIIAAVPVYFGHHPHATLPGSASSSTLSGLTTPGAIARNQTRTFDLPTSWGNALRDGTAKGIGVHHATVNAEFDRATLIIDWSA